jgi:hypothetical protein
MTMSATFSHYIKLLGLVRSIIFTFSSLAYAQIVHHIRAKLEYASIVWNSIMSTDASKLERIQALCFNRLYPEVHYNSPLALEELKLHTLRTRRHRLDALLTQVYIGFKFCPSEFLLGISETWHCSMSARRCAAAAYVVCRDVLLNLLYNML